MKIDRGARIGGQPAKLVRDIVADATNSDGFYADFIDEHLLRAWWRKAIDALIETGKIDRQNRGHALRAWKTARTRDKIFGAHPPNIPDFASETRSLIDALLAHKLIQEEGQETDGRTIYHVTRP